MCVVYIVYLGMCECGYGYHIGPASADKSEGRRRGCRLRASGNTYLQRRLQWSQQSQLTTYVLGAVERLLLAEGVDFMIYQVVRLSARSAIANRGPWGRDGVRDRTRERQETVRHIFTTTIAHIV